MFSSKTDLRSFCKWFHTTYKDNSWLKNVLAGERDAKNIQDNLLYIIKVYNSHHPGREILLHDVNELTAILMANNVQR